MTFLEQVTDFVSLGYTFTFTKQPFNFCIKISRGDQTQESWLPHDHQDEGSITRCISFMIDKMHTEETKSPPGATEND
jgi:hypothetical protein